VYFKVQTMDNRFNITQWSLGNGVTGYESFDPLSGLSTSIKHSKGQQTTHHQQFEFDSLGNLRARQDMLINQDETFTYDNLNRLESGFLNGSAELTLTYFDNGNIRTKSDVVNGGIYRYAEQHNECSLNPGPHALTSIGSRYRYCYDDRGNQLEARENGILTRRVNYTSYDKPSLIWSLNGESKFFYGADRARFKRIDRVNGDIKTTHFIGSVEVVTDSSTVYKRYIGGQVMVEVDPFGNSTETYFYLDHIGSIVVIADELGAIKEKLSYDAFGRRRDGQTLDRLDSLFNTSSISNALDITQKGFTGHEHVDHAEVIHMGGRIYDPNVGRFMQADPIVQAPDNGQSLNRYSYVFNNPLSFIDPTGYTSETPKASNCDHRGGAFCSDNSNDPTDVESEAQDADNDAATESASTDAQQTSSGAFEEQGGNVEVTEKNAQNFLIDVKNSMQGSLVDSNCGTICALAYAVIEVTHVLIEDVAKTVDNAVAGDINGTVSSAVLAIAKPLKALKVVTKGGDNSVYRNGSGTPGNLTPKPKDKNGLSLNVNPMPGKNQVIDTSKLDKLCAVCDNTKTGHVSIIPKDMNQMQGWIDSRGSGTTHPLTQELMNAVVDQVKR
jgi:RHS repeat-associated protein